MSGSEKEVPKTIRLLSLVLSFRNEEHVLPELINRLRAAIKKAQQSGAVKSYELIFINDASSDKSLEVLLEHAKGYNDIKILNMSRRFGVAPCVWAGFEHASGDVVIYMDTDLQDPPEIIPELIEAWASDPDAEIVHTVRLSRQGEPRVKMFLTRVGYLILNRLSSLKLPIEAGDFKLLSRKAVNHILQLKEKNPYIRGLACWIGFKQVFVRYHRQARSAGKTKFNVFGSDVINNFLDSALISFSSAPLKLAIYLGMISILLDFVLVGHALFEKIKGSAIPGWTAIMIAVLFLGGVQLFSIGIIGLYINSIHEQGKDRPRYILASTHGFSDERLTEVFPVNSRNILPPRP